MPVKAMNLFDAYEKDMLPKDEAYLVSSFINPNTGYTKYEIVSYSGVKAIYLDGPGLTFQSSGKKLHILIEPPTYPNKAIEPYLRNRDEQIPLRFSELSLHTARNQSKIYLAKEPIDSISSFTVARPLGYNISFVFYKTPELYQTLTVFFEQTFNKDAKIPQADAKTAAKLAIAVMEEHMTFKSDYGS